MADERDGLPPADAEAAARELHAFAVGGIGDALGDEGGGPAARFAVGEAGVFEREGLFCAGDVGAAEDHGAGAEAETDDLVLGGIDVVAELVGEKAAFTLVEKNVAAGEGGTAGAVVAHFIGLEGGAVDGAADVAGEDRFSGREIVGRRIGGKEGHGLAQNRGHEGEERAKDDERQAETRHAGGSQRPGMGAGKQRGGGAGWSGAKQTDVFLPLLDSNRQEFPAGKGALLGGGKAKGGRLPTQNVSRSCGVVRRAAPAERAGWCRWAGR